MEALGLVQQVDQQTHQLGNTLDPVYTESLEPIKVYHVFTSTYISDHCLVQTESSKTRNYKNFSPSD